jgi:hypothetical protein
MLSAPAGLDCRIGPGGVASQIGPSRASAGNCLTSPPGRLERAAHHRVGDRGIRVLRRSARAVLTYRSTSARVRLEWGGAATLAVPQPGDRHETPAHDRCHGNDNIRGWTACDAHRVRRSARPARRAALTVGQHLRGRTQPGGDA